jgi:hypothetical protein
MHRRLHSYNPDLSRLNSIDDLFSPLDKEKELSHKDDVTMFRIDDNVFIQLI